jgi:hypothetical protein
MGRGVLLVFCYVASASVPLDAEYLDYFPEALLPPHLLTPYAYATLLCSIIHYPSTGHSESTFPLYVPSRWIPGHLYNSTS